MVHFPNILGKYVDLAIGIIMGKKKKTITCIATHPLGKDGVNEHDKRDDLGLHSHKIKDSKNDMLGNKM